MSTFSRFLFRAGILAFTVTGASTVCANSNFVTNPYLPYPPSCARMPTYAPNGATELGALPVYEGVIQLPDLKTFEQVEFVLRAYRSPCHEEGRSLVWLEYRLTGEQAQKDIQVRLPWAAADYPGGTPGMPGEEYSGVLVHAQAPNTWGMSLLTSSELLTSKHHGYAAINSFFSDYYSYPLVLGLSWWFLMDIESPLLPSWEFHPIRAEAYNGRFTLRLGYYDNQLLQFEVPATAEMNFSQASEFPFTGRLSGNWVIEDARDQGLMLAISGLVKQPEPNYSGFAPTYGDYPTREMVLFYSHYTFDAGGRMLWLTGSTMFSPGTHQLTVPVDEVSQGQFRGSEPAQRRAAGQVTLTANNCNDITLDYDFSALGLGTGSKRLQRLFSLETAGYDCRDYAARVEANQ